MASPSTYNLTQRYQMLSSGLETIIEQARNLGTINNNDLDALKGSIDAMLHAEENRLELIGPYKYARNAVTSIQEGSQRILNGRFKELIDAATPDTSAALQTLQDNLQKEMAIFHENQKRHVNSAVAEATLRAAMELAYLQRVGKSGEKLSDDELEAELSKDAQFRASEYWKYIPPIGLFYLLRGKDFGTIVSKSTDKEGNDIFDFDPLDKGARDRALIAVMTGNYGKITITLGLEMLQTDIVGKSFNPGKDPPLREAATDMYIKARTGFMKFSTKPLSSRTEYTAKQILAEFIRTEGKVILDKKAWNSYLESLQKGLNPIEDDLLTIEEFNTNTEAIQERIEIRKMMDGKMAARALQYDAIDNKTKDILRGKGLFTGAEEEKLPKPDVVATTKKADDLIVERTPSHGSGVRVSPHN